MSLFRKKPKKVTPPPAREPDAPEAALNRSAGPPMSHESVLVLARLQGIADRLEAAVLRLERQTAHEDDDDNDPNGKEVYPDA